VCLLTAGSLASCPRMLKAADALHGAGHRVRVVSVQGDAWQQEGDRDLRRTRSWTWHRVPFGWRRGYGRRAWSGVRLRLAQTLVRHVDPHRMPLGVVVRSFTRTHAALVRAALAAPADLYYGGTSGGLAAAAAAARTSNVPYALDLEDFHTGEQDDDEAGRLVHALLRRTEAAILPGAALLTAASRPIAEAYGAAYGLAPPVVIHNTFPLPATPPVLESTERIRLCWFSQTIGAGRGLEDAVLAMGRTGLSGELHLRGRPAPGYLEGLGRLARSVAPGLTLVLHAPGSPDAMVESCRGHDVGLALEREPPPNRALCLTNKAFTYILAGLAVVLTDTPGQRLLARDLGEGALLYPPGDVEALAAGLRRWAEDKAALRRAKAAAWEAARRRWHWEHPDERGVLLEAVAKVLGR
jgi:glycosyltransferase involved in cell wall biosynthesis